MAKKTILNDTPDRLIVRYHQALRDAGIPVEKLILFGSYARGTARQWSDIDLCVVSQTFGKNRHDERIVLMGLTHKIDPMIEPHPYNSKDLQDPYDPIAAEIRKYGKVIV